MARGDSGALAAKWVRSFWPWKGEARMRGTPVLRVKVHFIPGS